MARNTDNACLAYLISILNRNSVFISVFLSVVPCFYIIFFSASRITNKTDNADFAYLVSSVLNSNSLLVDVLTSAFSPPSFVILSASCLVRNTNNSNFARAISSVLNRNYFFVLKFSFRPLVLLPSYFSLLVV